MCILTQWRILFLIEKFCIKITGLNADKLMTKCALHMLSES